jgi:hypothetical protein
MWLIAVISMCVVLVLPVSCPANFDDSEDNDPWGNEQTETRQFQAEAGENIFLIKYNPSGTETPAKYTGRANSAVSFENGRSLLSERFSPSTPSPDMNIPLISHYQPAVEFNALPPLKRASSPRTLTGEYSGYNYKDSREGDTCNFWLQDKSGNWIQSAAALKKIGTYCRVWVVNEHFTAGSSNTTDNKITQSQVDTLQVKFDTIYPLVTGFFGCELGGDPVNPGRYGPGGIDGDQKIQILVYDIDGDYKTDQTSGTAGFFWGKDEYRQEDLDAAGQSALKTNNAEMFYVDAHFADNRPNFIYSTLIHEFQHMIHHNQKIERLNKESETWYNEMLSMLAEDMIDPFIGIDAANNDHPVKTRLWLFNTYYWACGVTEWFDGDKAVVSYANAYAFGAYLVRNYGGAKLLHEMAHNDALNMESVESALGTLSGGQTGISQALADFPGVLLNNKERAANYADDILQSGNIATFNHQVSEWKPDETSPAYNFAAFDIMIIPNEKTTANRLNLGPLYASNQVRMGPYGIDIQNCGKANSDGIIRMPLSYYENSPVQMYPLGKKTDGTVVRK